MKCSRFAIVGVAALFAAGSFAFAQATQPGKDNKQGAKAPPGKGQGQSPASYGQQPEGQPPLPPGWTEADMQACATASTPGEQHAQLAKSIGTWTGNTKMWMAPGMEPTQSTCTSTVAGIMDGRFTKCKMEGEMPGMGPFNGFGIYGFDNVAQKYQAAWIDNCGTGIMTGIGELSSDGSTMTWKFSYTCPITKKPTTMREIDRFTGKDSKTTELFGIDPKSGKEFKMMEIVFTRSPGSQASAVPISNRKVDAGCANCVFHMPGVQSCKLAVMVDGQVYLVSGAKNVDAHQFCSGPKQVVVSGDIEEDYFVATAFEVKTAKP
jgi:hypothetical protein